jgi:hypothetical protein
VEIYSPFGDSRNWFTFFWRKSQLEMEMENAYCHICEKEVVAVTTAPTEPGNRDLGSARATIDHISGEAAVTGDSVKEGQARTKATLPPPQEIRCSLCNSTFVELGGQRIHEFLGDAVPSDSVTSSSSSSSSTGSNNNPIAISSSSAQPLSGGILPGGASAPAGPAGSDLVMQILNRVLGMGVQTAPDGQSTLLELLQQTSSASGGRPVGVVVRQPVSPSELSSISEALAGTTGVTRARGPRVSSAPAPSSSSASLAAPRNDMLGLLNMFSGVGVGGVAGAPSNTILSGPATIGGLRVGGMGPLGPLGLFGGLGGATSSLDDILHHILMNERSHAGVPPASTETIQSLKRVCVRNDTDTSSLGECSISQEKFETGDVCVMLTCGHNFKQEAIERWLAMHDTCPTCRVRVSDNN